MTATRMPTFYIPHGGGPCFFMEWQMGPPDTWDHMATWLRGLDATLPAKPKALLVVSAHWEAPVVSVMTAAAPPLLYDYSGFPPHTYALTWPAPGSPALADRVLALLAKAGIQTRTDAQRGFDHGVFIPLKVTYPDAQVSTVQVSLLKGLDPGAHLALGRALAPLRDEGVLIIGSGMSYHNMRGFGTAGALRDSARFGDWLADTVSQESAARAAALADWSSAPGGRESHPREEHLLPLMVAAGAAGADRGQEVFRDEVMGSVVSAIRFG
ncbi:MAG: dioxygenase [Candidatus Sericytochromatia bacterium]|nr:dioxygenase [Candidatus Sericytochromatia bacterium]